MKKVNKWKKCKSKPTKSVELLKQHFISLKTLSKIPGDSHLKQTSREVHNCGVFETSLVPATPLGASWSWTGASWKDARGPQTQVTETPVLFRQSTPHFHPWSCIARPCYTLHLVFAMELIGSLGREIWVQMRGWETDPSEYLHAKCDAFGLLHFCRSTPARPSSFCSPPHLHAVPPSAVAWPKNVVTAGRKPTFLFASGFSVYTWHMCSVWDQHLEKTGTCFSVGTTFIDRDLQVGKTVLKKHRYQDLWYVLC